MDKGGSKNSQRNKSSDVIEEVGEITFDDLIRADGDQLKSSDERKTSYVDPLSFTEEEEDEEEGEEEDDDGGGHVAEMRLQKTALTTVGKVINRNTLPSGTKSIILSTTSNNNVIQNKVVATTTSSSGYVKIAPRLSTSNASTTSTTIGGTTTVARTSNGKIIYLQRQGSASVPVRVPTTSSAGNSQSKQTMAIQVIRNADGKFVPLKAGKGGNVPNVGKKMITTIGGGSTGQMLIRTPIKTETTAVGSTIISSVETTKPKVRQSIHGNSVISKSTYGNGSTSGKVIMQSTSGPRQVVVSQNLIKLSPTTSSGQLQAIQMPGKAGLQYVRVLNNTSGITHKIATTETTNSPKYTVVRQTKPSMVVVKSPLNDKDRRMLATVPTLRKVTEVRGRDNSEGYSNQTQKLSQINSQIQRFSSNPESKSSTSPSKYFVVSKSLIRSTVASQNQKIMQQRQSLIEVKQEPASASQLVVQPRKLYSVLRPTSAESDIKVKIKAEPLKRETPPVVGRSLRSSPPPAEDPNVTIRRKHCNCTKSQCLKLYCDCFANGEFCQDCNCKDCLNNLDNEDERQKAIRICLERNPNSFKPKITAAANESDQRLHNKGCNCKRSGCLKNYCECYEAKIPCSSNCKCIGCRNVEDHPDLDMDVKKYPVPSVQTGNRVKRPYEEVIKSRSPVHQPAASSNQSNIPVAASNSFGPPAEKQPCNFITQDVVDATIQCLIAQADECKKGELLPYQTEKMIMEELGRCLVEIIDFSIRNTDQN